jgi:hypothetical protein
MRALLLTMVALFGCTAVLFVLGLLVLLQRNPGLKEDASASEPEIKAEDTTVLVYEGSPAKLREEIWNVGNEGLPEQWTVFGWRSAGWPFTVSLSGSEKGDYFQVSTYSQMRPGFSEPDLFTLIDMDDDGVVDRRLLSFRSTQQNVSYVDLNMDGILDTMSVNDENASADYILLDDAWTRVGSLNLMGGGRCELTIGGEVRHAVFTGGRWELEPSGQEAP